MGIGWEGEKVRIVPLDFDRHFENCYRWINDPEVNEWLAVGDLPMSRLAEKEWFEARQEYSEHLADNDLSKRMQEKSGYRQYGVRPQANWKRGEHRDMALTYLSREDWEASL
ncbi:MAG: hypothetical protein IIC73_04175 [Armatimonadetes bacterium]|nr:hypothetical protein [Armatimonadota bacterium]